MPSVERRLKKVTRARMKRTGEQYTVARRRILEMIEGRMEIRGETFTAALKEVANDSSGQ